MDVRWLHGGEAVVVVKEGSGEPLDASGNANPDYQPAIVARLVTEQVEPAQLRDSDPADDAEDGAAVSGTPGELRGLIPPQGPNAGPTVVTRSTAAEQPADAAAPPAPGTSPDAAATARIAELEAQLAEANAALADARQAEVDENAPPPPPVTA